MSAAVWAETEPYDPHQRLGTIRIPDQQTARMRVRLVVWGASDTDRRIAEELARTDPRVYRHQIVKVEQAEQAATSAGDPDAIAHHVAYDRTWAVYPHTA